MKEYRVVATVDEKHMYDGRTYHYDAMDCRWEGLYKRKRTFDKKRAEYWLQIAKQKCPEFDRKSRAACDNGSIHFWQTNIRIQTREVSEWEDL